MSGNGEARGIRRAELGGAGVALLASRIDGVLQKMSHTLFRTARSGVINTAHDFSCCLLTADHRLVASGISLPIHVMSGPDRMAASMTEFHPALKRGDAFLHNSPYHGCSHPADHSILVPVIDDVGVHRFTVLAKAHQADCGNAEPTTYAATATDVYEEGALIFPCVKVQSDYEHDYDVIRMCRMRIRVPEQWWGDYLALLGAARAGERELRRLADEISWLGLQRHCEDWFSYSDAMMKQAIGRLPNGDARASSCHDPMPGVPDGIPISAAVNVDAVGGQIVVDLRDNPDCQPCGLNLSEATARTAAMVGVFNSLGTDVPPNAGSFRRLQVLLREGCVAGIPRHPFSCSVATTNVADRVANAVQSALASLGDGVGMAEIGGVSAPSTAVVSGVDVRGDPTAFVDQLFLLETAGGATPRADGWLLTGHAGSAGMVRRDSVELDELTLPIRVHAQRIVTDSEGAGRHRGAPSGYVEYGPVAGELEVVFASDSTVNAAAGVRGGGAGAPADQYVRRAGRPMERIAACTRIVLREGDSIVSISSAGGGYGVPSERDPRKVRHDVAEGWITVKRAERVYGVVIGDDGDIDDELTARARLGDLASPDGVVWKPRARGA